MSGQLDDVRVSRIAPWKYVWWVVVGGLFGTGIIGLLTIGLPLVALGLGLFFIGVKSSALSNGSMRGTIAGLAAAPLYLAWLNRDGPGRVCRTINSGPSCVEQYSPWPFVVIAVGLVVGCVVVVRRS